MSLIDDPEFMALVRAASERMTPRDWEEQRMSLAYGNLACSTNHHPMRAAFAKLAAKKGWTVEEFDAWAEGREWRGEQ